jgi:hypothetical protein
MEHSIGAGTDCSVVFQVVPDQFTTWRKDKDTPDEGIHCAWLTFKHEGRRNEIPIQTL